MLPTLRGLLASCLLLAVASLASAEIVFEGESKVQPYSIAKVRAKSPDYKSFVYRVTSEGGKKVKVERGENGWLLFTGPPGAYTVSATAGRLDKDSNLILEDAEFTVTIGDAPPPVPPPGPPPPPTPLPEPAPIPVAGFRVLIVYETADLSRMPAAQSAIIYSKSVRDFLNAKCVVGPDSKTKEFRIYDKDVDASGESKIWQDAMKRPRTSVPWLIVSDGTQGYEGPLPADVDATLAILRKYVPATRKEDR